MDLNKFINPFFIYKHRDQIMPYIKRQRNDMIFNMAKLGIFLSDNVRKLNSFNKIHTDRRCFIIGNGPSLRVDDLKRLKGEITFGANKIYLAFDKTDWRPTYYMVIDSLVAKQDYEEINALRGFPKFIPSFAIEKWGIPFDDSIYFKYLYYQSYPKPPDFSENPIYGIFAGATVIYCIIQLAFFMDFKEIYLIGMDFNFKEPTTTQDGILVYEGETNHFHKQYRKPGEMWHKPRLHEQAEAFQTALEKANSTGRKIFNATRGGKLNIFPRKDFDSLF